MTKFIIIGTSHISPKSIKQVSSTIKKQKPDYVAIELCPKRFHSLKHPSKPSSPMFFILSKIQKELGKSTGIFPGKEMLTAIKAARSVNSKILFIDKNIEQIAYEISQIPLKEKLQVIADSIIGFSYVKLTKIDLKDIPPEKLIKEAIQELKKKFPSLYKILIKDRNKHMIQILKKLKCKKVVVVVGAGHKKAIERGLKCSSSVRKKSRT